MNDLKQLMRDNVAAPPPDRLDLDALVPAGRRRVRRRRTALLGCTAALAAGAVVAVGIGGPGGSGRVAEAAHPPKPDAPTIRLADATQAVTGRDYEVLASFTNQNLDRDNGQYFDGVTDDGLVLFRDGPREAQPTPRFALMDPATGAKDWLPDLDIGWAQTWPVELGADRLVLAGVDSRSSRFVTYVFDRAGRQWTTMSWPGLPKAAEPFSFVPHDGRLYLRVPASVGQPPPGGWPTGPDGEADDADAEGDTYHLWSVSLTDSSDVRDEGMTVGDVAFTQGSMVWTDRSGGDPGRVHVRSLATDEEHSFDPQEGEKCNVLSFGATGDRIVMSEYCGTYADGVRDDRVQVLTTDGDQVVTLQDNGVDGALAGPGSSLVTMTAYQPKLGGTYVYDLAADRLLRVSEGFSRYGSGGGAPDGMFLYGTPVNHGKGQTTWLAKLLD